MKGIADDARPISPTPHRCRPSRATLYGAALFWLLWLVGAVLNAQSPTAGTLLALAASSGLGLLMWTALIALVEESERRIAIVIGSSVTAAIAHGLLHTLIVDGAARLDKPSMFGALTWVPIYLLWIAIPLAMGRCRAAAERERRIAGLEVAQLRAQMAALRYQINPHFLFNTLNSVSALMLDRRIAEADQALVRLADFFRASLADQTLEQVTLAEEFAAQRRYLEIEQIRFGARLSAEFDLPEALESARLLPFLLQPLVENAIRHGLSPGGAVHIRISARREDDRLILCVTDDGSGISARGGTGIGLDNIGKRLRLRYGDSATIEAGPGDEGGFTATLRLPYEAISPNAPSPRSVPPPPHG